MPRDILSDSLAVLRIVEHEDEENWPLEEKPSCRHTSKNHVSVPLTSHTYMRDDTACYYNYGLGDGVSNRQCDPLYQYKTSSLPAAASISQTWDNTICSALRISPEDISNQLTLLDLASFKAIKAEELTSCGWNKSNKLTVAPNVVEFTKRFNRVTFWTVQEILNQEQSPKARAEVVTHFIKIAKKLHELNNLHSLYAVIAALRSASIFRLKKTWACVSKKDKVQFDKLADLFAEKDNWKTLREYLNSISLPCIPYLGVFKTDLVYIDLAIPVGPDRTKKMDMVLKAVERYQTSEYDIAPSSHVANYLNSVRYIEELQKFLEDEQFKLSEKLEPSSPPASCNGSKESMKEMAGPGPGPGPSTPYTLSPSHRLGSGSLRLPGSYAHSKFIPTHRKCRSLGSNIFGKSSEEKVDEKTPAGSVNLLDDTLLESPGSVVGDKLSHSLPHSDSTIVKDLECDFEGFVRRKTILKEGRKVSLSSWQRYWLQISGNILVFYAAKSFKGSNRGDFRAERCKVLSLEGWLPMYVDGDSPDAFQLVNHHSGTLYKFKTGVETTARQWVAKMEEVANKMVKPLPANLMSFE